MPALNDHFGEKFASDLREAGHYVFDDEEDEDWHLSGCSDDEIKEIEEAQQVKLPARYKEFLSTMGKNAGDFFRSEQYYYPILKELKDYCQSVLSESASGFVLNPTDFVFWGHNGWMYAFFDTASGEPDPPVYFFKEGFDTPGISAESFTAWMYDYLRNDLIVRRQSGTTDTTAHGKATLPESSAGG